VGVEIVLGLVVESTPPLSHASRRVTTAAGGPSRTGTFRRSPVRVPLRSTVADLLTFLDLHLNPSERGLGRAAAVATAPHVTKRRHAHGLGWIRTPLRGRAATVVWHTGGTGGFRSFAGFVDGAEVALVVLSNSARWVDGIAFRLLEVLTEP
jgi:CubicO group peptidase (beta-lactamase class C family)